VFNKFRYLNNCLALPVVEHPERVEQKKRGPLPFGQDRTLLKRYAEEYRDQLALGKPEGLARAVVLTRHASEDPAVERLVVKHPERTTR
jgi:hypothetical protein